ncbi:hypothetical protein CN981_08485 [Priestia megaterium]|nr:hypothetical protein CN981_08485 [Priestia megaterium]
MKVIIAGSRSFKNYDLLKNRMIHALSNYKPEEVEIVSGGAYGADQLGERFAKMAGCALKVLKPDWDLYGKRAGFMRNWDMAKYADACVVFWDGKSNGTKHMIDLAKREGLKLKVVKY